MSQRIQKCKKITMSKKRFLGHPELYIFIITKEKTRYFVKFIMAPDWQEKFYFKSYFYFAVVSWVFAAKNESANHWNKIIKLIAMRQLIVEGGEICLEGMYGGKGNCWHLEWRNKWLNWNNKELWKMEKCLMSTMKK